ncbi:MAG: bifunctional diaminohydroxyphosphoribosylaminopyrimidine deaminase/5-amino-6-(5-phosphoribosylamino)uracil reductase RibD, partial [Actinomycetota bacterium]|nr:bifunctional diaminohydroxyphosphoribosylaminopyrimidine deaminase/5-amino-6-(5-phosphoribosylamino)uracil reductase RibD [Actinomycetota bacterium]
VLAEASHAGAGSPHAEALVLQDAEAEGATLYVTLEPCAHQGRMPPCAPAVAAAGVARVVAATKDPDERVAGRGFEILRAAGVAVEVGLMEAEARRVNAAFLFQRSTGRPLVTLKLALTLDGRLSAPDGSSQWITGPGARSLVQRRRSEVDAVVVGAGTVVADDPSLTVRDVPNAHQPARVVVDSSGRTPLSARIFGGEAELIVATTSSCHHDTQTAFKERGAEVVVLADLDGRVDLAILVEALGRRGWLELYCEGGGELASSLLRGSLVDRLELNYGPLLAGRGGADIGELGVTSLGDAARWTTVSIDRIDDDARVVLESSRLTALLAPQEGGD